MRNFLRFFISKIFWKNFILAIIVFSLIIYGILAYLDSYTRHGESVPVPDFIGMHFSELDEFAQENDVQYKVIDTLFFDEQPKGTILKQNPEAFYIHKVTGDTLYKRVKENRKIYLTINALVPPTIPIPVKKDQSYRIAKQNLASRNIKVKKVTYIPSNCSDCVLKILHKSKEISFDARIPEGDAIELVLGIQSDETTPVPQLIGVTLDSALLILSNKSLTLGAAQWENCNTKSDSSTAIIFDQNPSYLNDKEIRKGSSINVWLKKN